jgi:hypothetical protein
MSGSSITIQELINLKNTNDSAEDPTTLIDSLQDDITSLDVELRKYIDNSVSDIDMLVDSKVLSLQNEIDILDKKIDEINLTVEKFKYYDTEIINRNKNNDIIEIIFKNNFRITIDYINFTYSDTYENYFPSKINYFNDSDILLSIEELNTLNNSLSSLNFRLF